jgi:vesicle-fusing ATPase
MDGVDQLNNVLVIGMTNRKDMIDDALLRPGRFEIHIEISLPDEAGRVQILKIHTSKMKDNKVMAEDVDVNELANLTKNFSGAELQGLVRSATTFAFNRHIKVGTMAGIADDVSDMQITRADFLSALEEVHAAFGVSEEELSTVVDNGIIHFSPDIEVCQDRLSCPLTIFTRRCCLQTILRDGKLFVEQVKNSERTRLVSVLLHGKSSSDIVSRLDEERKLT